MIMEIEELIVSGFGERINEWLYLQWNEKVCGRNRSSPCVEVEEV